MINQNQNRSSESIVSEIEGSAQNSGQVLGEGDISDFKEAIESLKEQIKNLQKIKTDILETEMQKSQISNIQQHKNEQQNHLN